MPYEDAHPDHPGLEVIDSPRHGGVAVQANLPIEAGARIFEFVGPILREEDITDFTHCLEIGDGRFIGPSGLLCDFANHSCDPNGRVVHEGGRVYLDAVRDIEVGEQVTFDYGTIINSDPTTFECACGASRCRGVVGSYGTLPPALQAEYEQRGMVPEFVLKAAATRAR